MIKNFIKKHMKRKKSRMEIEIIMEAMEAVRQVEKAKEDYRQLIKKYGQHLGN